MPIGAMSVVIKGDISDFNKNISSLQKQLNSSTKGLQTVAKSMTSVGDGMTKGLTLPILAVGAVLLKVGKEFDDAYDKIRIGTGATGKVLDGLKTDFKEVAKDSASSFGDISTTIAGLNSRLGLTGKPLQELTTQMTNFARITNSDINTLVPATTRVFGDWSIATKDQSKAMDTLFKVSQTTGISAATLAERVVELGAPLRNLGFSFEEATALMGKWEAEGVNTTTVFSGLRQALRVFAKEGVTDTKAALMDIIERMKNAGTSGEAASIGMAYFGKGLNDVVDTARGGKFDIAELVNTIEGSTDTINGAAAATDDWQEKLIKLKNKAMVQLEPAASKVFDLITRGVEKATPKIEELTKWFGKLTISQMDNILKWGLIVAAIGPVLSISGRMLTSVIQLRNNILLLNKVIQASPLLTGAAAIAAVAALGFVMDKAGDSVDNLSDSIGNKLGATAIRTLIPIGQLKQGIQENISIIDAMRKGYLSADEAAHVNIFTIEKYTKLINERKAAEEEANRVKEESTNLTEDQIAAETQLFDAGELGEAQMWRHVAAQEASQTATEEGTGAIDEQAKSVDELRQEFNDLISEIFGITNAENDLQESEWALEDAQKAVIKATKEHGEGSREAEQAVNDYERELQKNISILQELYSEEGLSIERKEELKTKLFELLKQTRETSGLSQEQFINMSTQFGLSGQEIIDMAGRMGIVINNETRARLIKITAEDNATRTINNIYTSLMMLGDKTVHINTIYGSKEMGLKEGGIVGFSQGGFLDSILSASAGINLPKFDNGGVLAMLHPPEIVLNAKEAMQLVWNMATKPMDTKQSGGINNTYNITSPKPLTESEIKRQIDLLSRELGYKMGLN